MAQPGRRRSDLLRVSARRHSTRRPRWPRVHRAASSRVVAVKVSPTSLPHFKWCEFEERPGPAPLTEDDPSFVVCLNK